MRETELLVVGGGPAGLSAAVEAASHGCEVMVVDSDLALGGQLIKQTHKFFGSESERAGTRGFKIAEILLDELNQFKGKVEVLTNTTAESYYRGDGVVGCMTNEDNYWFVKPKKIVNATGASEKILPFPNNDLPGVYGAGAIQTLMNVYGVVPGKKVLMIGAGNIGLVVSYQLLQAGVDVVGIVEFLPNISGYWVHAAKVRRLGVPVLLKHTITRAIGENKVEGAYIQAVDDNNQLMGEPQKIDCDIICMSVGLSPTVDLLWQAGCKMMYVPELCGYVARRDNQMRTSNADIWAAGDAHGIEEASAAMVEGRIAGLGAAHSLDHVDRVKFGERLGIFWQRLDNLRAGATGEKIRCGVGKCTCQAWEVD